MDAGTAARFFYCAKASKSERCGSAHPTVKPVKLLEWLVKLITPPGGIVLDPFAGTGSTGQAARNWGFGCILIEQDESYVADIKRRLRSIPRDESDPC
jgi:site-specific DNA-methyltransferase (adenine-specific)